MTDRDAVRRLGTWPRWPIANLPTPLIRVDRLAARLGIDHAYVKMDAETGFALGGNKVRKLEFELAPGRLEGVTSLVTAGGPQSNHCRVTAAAAARLGLGCVLVVNGPAPEIPTGNARLHRLLGAEIVTVRERADRAPTMDEVARRVAADGGCAHVVAVGASTGLGSLGYARAAEELCTQLDTLEDECSRTLLFVATSSCGTLAGLLLGLSMLERTDVHLFGISADAPADELRSTTLGLAGEGAALLDTEPDLGSIPLTLSDAQVGDGYGIPTLKSRAATDDFARLAGILLDPTYSSKAAAGLIDHVEHQGVDSDARVVFLHTGGAPGLLA